VRDGYFQNNYLVLLVEHSGGSPPTQLNMMESGFSPSLHELTIGDLIVICIHGWRVILSCAIVGLAVGLGLAFVLRPTYRAEVLLSVTDNSSMGGGHSDVLSQFSGLASLAGVSMGGDQNKAESVAELTSRDITDRFIQQENLAPVLFANRWDAASGKWRDTTQHPPPTEGQAFRLFDKRVRKLGQDKKTGLVTLVIEWSDRKAVADWANRLVRLANDTLRQKAITEATNSLQYLNNELSHNNEVELRKTLSDLIESQQKTLMLANERPDFVFKVIDPAKIPDSDDYVSPKKPVFGAVGLFAGMAVGAMFVSITFFNRRRKGMARSVQSTLHS
jgi:uncharacterized protein involved in exopolysaccharide biosynthesis